MLKNRRLLCIALSSTLVLSACGFKLRTSVLGSDLPFKSLYLAFPEASALGSELRRNIRGSGELVLTDTPEEAEATLTLVNETRQKTILSLNSQGRVREFALHYSATVSLKDKQQVELMPPTTIALKREISYNEAQVLAKDTEEAMLYRDMQSDMVQQILRRVAAIKPKNTEAEEQTVVSPPAK